MRRVAYGYSVNQQSGCRERPRLLAVLLLLVDAALALALLDRLALGLPLRHLPLQLLALRLQLLDPRRQVRSTENTATLVRGPCGWQASLARGPYGWQACFVTNSDTNTDTSTVNCQLSAVQATSIARE